MPSEPPPPKDRETCLDSVINEIRQEPPCRTPAERDLRYLAVRAEVAELREKAAKAGEGERKLVVACEKARDHIQKQWYLAEDVVATLDSVLD